jgi:hypothetical protein
MTITRRTEEYIVGCDLGQARDYSVFAFLQRVTIQELVSVQEGFEPPRLDTRTSHEYLLTHLERVPLGTGYPEVVASLGRFMKALPEAKRPPSLVVDATGVGRPVVDMIRKTGLRPIAVTITGGADENGGSHDFRVPKRNLVSVLLVLLQSDQLRIAEALAETENLVTELINFKAKISAAGHESYEASLESIHDDLVLATAIAAWWGERRRVEAHQTPINFMSRQSRDRRIPNHLGRAARAAHRSPHRAD